MKIAKLLALGTGLSLTVMLVIDYFLGPKAEFLNAWSALERLFGREPGHGDSVIYQKYGEVGELLAVLGVNFLIGCLLAALALVWRRVKPT